MVHKGTAGAGTAAVRNRHRLESPARVDLVEPIRAPGRHEEAGEAIVIGVVRADFLPPALALQAQTLGHVLETLRVEILLESVGAALSGNREGVLKAIAVKVEKHRAVSFASRIHFSAWSPPFGKTGERLASPAAMPNLERAATIAASRKRPGITVPRRFGPSAR